MSKKVHIRCVGLVDDEGLLTLDLAYLRSSLHELAAVGFELALSREGQPLGRIDGRLGWEVGKPFLHVTAERFGCASAPVRQRLRLAATETSFGGRR